MLSERIGTTLITGTWFMRHLGCLDDHAAVMHVHILVRTPDANSACSHPNASTRSSVSQSMACQRREEKLKLQWWEASGYGSIPFDERQ
jgi:hypothetical protein